MLFVVSVGAKKMRGRREEGDVRRRRGRNTMVSSPSPSRNNSRTTTSTRASSSSSLPVPVISVRGDEEDVDRMVLLGGSGTETETERMGDWRGNNNNPRSFPHSVKQQCWDKAEKIKGRDPDRWRRDPLGNTVFRKLVGCPGCLCHDYDHILPFSKVVFSFFCFLLNGV